MPRLPGGPARDLPACPRPGHEGRKVVKDGRYGSPPRQRFRCSDGAEFHRFVPELPRHATDAGTCDSCDTEVATHQGPVTGRRYDFPVREVAAAFVAVGGGSSYQRAALRARAASGRELLEGAWGGNTVAEWLDALAPVVLADQAETSWPETLVLDSTRFMVETVRTGTSSLAFNVLGAYGYPASGQGRPRVWALAAYPRAREDEWADFLRTLDTTTAPRLVITDNAAEIGNAVRQVWSAQPGPSFPLPYVKRCEHHLYENARDALTEDRVAHWGSVRMKALSDAFQSMEGWDVFRAITHRQPKLTAIRDWTAANDALVVSQAGVRGFLPDHHSTAALDAHLGTVRDYLDSRSFVLRNQHRTTLLLGLIRLHLNGTDNPRRYAELIRASLDAHGGHGPRQRRKYDTGTSRRLPRELRQPGSLRA